jgi:hypothetical protein
MMMLVRRNARLCAEKKDDAPKERGTVETFETGVDRRGVYVAGSCRLQFEARLKRHPKRTFERRGRGVRHHLVVRVGGEHGARSTESIIRVARQSFLAVRVRSVPDIRAEFDLVGIEIHVNSNSDSTQYTIQLRYPMVYPSVWRVML